MEAFPGNRMLGQMDSRSDVTPPALSADAARGWVPTCCGAERKEVKLQGNNWILTLCKRPSHSSHRSGKETITMLGL
ncbi:UNVERIFIED_CONTAM: hypothetical protein K2H54_003290 [Gekko kuhli]